MPLYIFVCEVCGESEEVLQGYTRPPPVACDKCGAAESMIRSLHGKPEPLKADKK